MFIGIAILTNKKAHNIARDITLDIHTKYNSGIETALLPQHISLKQSFPYNGEISEIESYMESFCLNLKSFKIIIDKVEVNEIGEETVITWFEVRESKELRDLHEILCKDLKQKFNIDPLGFDGNDWKFHSTLSCSKIKQDSLKSLIFEYNNREIGIDFEAKEIVMFCCLGNGTKTSDYFSFKIFDIGKGNI